MGSGAGGKGSGRVNSDWVINGTSELHLLLLSYRLQYTVQGFFVALAAADSRL